MLFSNGENSCVVHTINPVLLSFLLKRERLGSKSLDVTCESACFKVTKEGWSEVSELITSQEEADTRVFLHALHAANEGARSVVITADDTDIMVISLGLNRDIPCSIYQKSGTKNRRRYIDICKLASSLGEKVCDVLIGYHSFTGCDTASAFEGCGKLSALKLLKKRTSTKRLLAKLGSHG